MELKYVVIKYPDVKLNMSDAPKLRGYFGNKYKQSQSMHNHKDEKFIYKYPLVQYKVIGKSPYLVGICEGANELLTNCLCESKIQIDEKIIDIGKIEIVTNIVNFEVTDEICEYKFVTPWVALNQINERKYSLSTEVERKELLKKILIGNLISMSKGINYNVDKQIVVELEIKSVSVTLKGIPMYGFIGSFKTNFLIPDYTGLGRSVSRGFGTVKIV